MQRVKSSFRLKTKNQDSYLELVLQFPLSSIRSERQLAEAQKMMDRLLGAGVLDEGQAIYLDALSDLVATYEDVHYPIAPVSDADMLRHLLEAKGISQSRLSKDSGLPKSTISEILAGKKPFSRQVIRKLADYFGVAPGILAANY